MTKWNDETNDERKYRKTSNKRLASNKIRSRVYEDTQFEKCI